MSSATQFPPTEACDEMQTFQLHPLARVLTPEAPGLEALCKGLAEGLSLTGCQSGDPIALRREARQWLYCETSGSSGTPKILRRSPASWRASFDLIAARFGIGPSDIYATLGTLGHSLTLYASVEAMHLGAALAGFSGLKPKIQALRLAETGTTVLWATPTQLRLLLAGAEAAKVPALPALRHLVSSGGKRDAALHTKLAAFCPNAQLHEVFGAGETSYVTLSDATTPKDSVGRAFPGVTLCIGSPSAPCPPGTTGEIHVASAYLFDGYAQGRSAETQWDGAFLRWGEMGYVDDNGYLFLRGRRNRMVTVSDVNVFPEEIEQVVSQISGVAQAVALPIPDPKRGHRIVCVVETAGQTVPDGRELRRLCRAQLSPQAVPKAFQMVEKIPMLPAGKPDLQRLRTLVDLAP